MSESAALAAGGIAAILASACCLVPLALVFMGLGGAWIANFQLLEPYRPVFIAVAVVALFFAYRRIFRPVSECKPGEVCALPSTRRTYKGIFWAVVGLVGIALSYPYVAPLFY
ncbi:MAG: mercuric ion transporter MerT [Betaproteobacteria bacterium]